MGWLEVPDKWAHLKVNASKRSTTGSRKKKALQVVASKKAATKKVLSRATGRVQEWAEEKLQFVQESDGDEDDEDDADDAEDMNEGEGSDEEEES